MNILKAFGGFFTKLWRWIKETAWVQPLLIVGAIFALIFSIPKVTSWVECLGVGSTDAYYTSFRLSLEGETGDDKYATPADKITEAMNQWSNFDNKYSSYAEYISALKASENNPIATYGEKFFVAYVGKDCSGCKTAQPGFEALQDNWGGKYAPLDGRSFKLYTIYSDQESTNDEDYDTDDDKKAFCRYLDKYDDADFFSEAGGRLSDMTPYRTNANLTSSNNYQYFTEADHTNFQTPTILLVDFSEEAWNLHHSRVGVSEVLFGVDGDGDYSKASLLLSMWNHTAGVSTSSYSNPSDSSNKFSDYYNA